MNSKRLYRKMIFVFSMVALIVSFSSPSLSLSAPQEPEAAPVYIDLTISIYKTVPEGTQRVPYENIINYFADAVYEASNGANKLRNVTFYQNGTCANKADIVWVNSCHPNANVSGRVVTGQHVNFCDVFPGSSNFLQNDWEQQGGGYTLGHEWGHYYYSMYDEYQGHTSYNGIFHFPHSTDVPVPDAIMRNQWSARGGNYKWLNFSTSKNYLSGGPTAQSRVYGVSSWDTLTRPVSSDPRSGPQAFLPLRIYHPELIPVAPAPGGTPRIDLTANHSARSALNIYWGSCRVAYQIVIDKSGSMQGAKKLPNVKKAANMLVDLAPLGYAKVGVISYNGSVSVEQPMIDINNISDKTTVKSKINNITAGGDTAIGDAAQKALNDLKNSAGPQYNRVVYLLTDGNNTAGSNPLSVIPSYQSANIPLYTFGYGNDADATLLQKLAADSKGKYYFSPTSLIDLTKVFQDANLQSSPSVGIIAGVEQYAPRSGSSNPEFVSVPFHVDKTLGSINAVVSYKGPIGQMEFELMRPNFSTVEPVYCDESGDKSETVCFFDEEVLPSDVGQWALTILPGSMFQTFYYQVSGLPAQTFTYAASITAQPGNIVESSQPIKILAVLGKEVLIKDALVSAIIEPPEGGIVTLVMHDDGQSGDAVGGDGVYAAVFEPEEKGAYNISVQFLGLIGTAKTTLRSYTPSHPLDGTALKINEYKDVDDTFQRYGSIHITVLENKYVHLPFVKK